MGKLPKGGKWDFLSFKPGEKYIPQVDCTKDQIGISVCWGELNYINKSFKWTLKRSETWWNCTTLTSLIRTQGMKRHIKNKVLSAAGEIFKSIHQDSTYINRNFTNPCRWINVLAKIIDFQYIPVWTFLDTGIFPVYFPNEAFFQYIFQYPTPVQVFPVYSSIFQYRWPPWNKVKWVKWRRFLLFWSKLSDCPIPIFSHTFREIGCWSYVAWLWQFRAIFRWNSDGKLLKFDISRWRAGSPGDQTSVNLGIIFFCFWVTGFLPMERNLGE